MANSVDSLLLRPFWERTFQEKLDVKRLGRPTPDLNLTQKSGARGNGYLRKFNRKVYDSSWVCGCEVRNALFCFPCLLFGDVTIDSWNKGGVKDLGHMTALIKNHAANEKHISNVLELSILGHDISTLLTRAYHAEKGKNDQKVERNKYILSRIIDCIKFCSSFEVVVRGDDSENSGVFLGLIDLISSIDSAVREHMEWNDAFKGFSKSLQNDLLDTMLETCQDVILEEMKQAEFVAIMAEEMTDVSDKIQIALVFRYEKNGITCERFWGFLNPREHSTKDLASCILNELGRLFNDSHHKIIAQTYHGASLVSGGAGGVQAKVKAQYPNAHYMHSYVHKLNLIMEGAASKNQSARIFFLNLAGFHAFFAGSSERLSVLQAVATRRVSNGSQREWNFKSQSIYLVHKYKDCLLECFLILEKAQSSKTCLQAIGLRRCLEDGEFLAWLSFFNKLMPFVDLVQKRLYSSFDAESVNHALSQLINAVNVIKGLIQSIGNIANGTNGKAENNLQKFGCRRSDVYEVCERIVQEAQSRFRALDHLEAAKLLSFSRFGLYKSNFPIKELHGTTHTYSMLDKQRLKSELKALYQKSEFRKVDGVSPLLQFIVNNNLRDTFSELTKLSQILVTTPMVTNEPDRCFSCLRKIKTFLRNTMLDLRLSALAMLSVERDMVSSIPEFNSRVIDKFCLRNQQCKDFIYQY